MASQPFRDPDLRNDTGENAVSGSDCGLPGAEEVKRKQTCLGSRGLPDPQVKEFDTTDFFERAGWSPIMSLEPKISVQFSSQQVTLDNSLPLPGSLWKRG